MDYSYLRIPFLFLVLLFLICSSSAFAQPDDEMMDVIQDLCWSPDGEHIFFSSMRVKTDYSDFSPEKWSIYKFERKTGKSEKIVESAFTVSVSPDGKRIAVGRVVDGNRDIYIANANGKIKSRLTYHPDSDSAPSWSPDGKQIAFNSRRTGTTEIFVIHVDGSGIRQLTKSGEDKSYNPSWSPDGKLVAYYLEKGDGRDQIHIIKKDGTGVLNLTSDDFNNIYPGWMSSNKLIYGRGEPKGKTLVFSVTADGKNKVQVLALESSYARYSQDGSMIAYVDETERNIKILKADGTEAAVVNIP